MRFRYLCILNIIKDHEPDVVCLQEVVSQFVDVLVNNEFIKEKYFIMLPRFHNGYGTFILSKLQFVYQIHGFESYMDRNLLVGIFKINNELIGAGNVHLESLNSIDLRYSQMQVSHKYLEHFSTVLYMGDFNFCSDKNYNLIMTRRDLIRKGKDKNEAQMSPNEPLENINFINIFNDYIDIWPHLHNNDPGYTYNSEVNKMLMKYEEMRYDRIAIKSETWEPISIDLVGNSSVKEFQVDGESYFVYPSDHFGLISKISFK